MAEQPPAEELPKAEDLSTTMRIDITPHLKEALAAQVSSGATQLRRTGRITIKIPRKTGEPSEIGSADFQEILQNVYDATLITDMNGQIVTVNPRAMQFFRSERSELRSRNVTELICGASEGLVPMIRKNLDEDRYTLIQAYCLRSDGTIFPAEISANRLHLSARDYLSFFIRDISWRKEAEERLRTGYTAIQNSGGGIVVADLEGNVGFCNPAMTSLLGFRDAEQIQGHNLREFIIDGALADEIVEHVKARRTWTGELQMQRPDRRTFFAQGSVVPNVNADDELTGMVLSVLDITSLKEAQHQLECYAQELQEKNALLESDQNMAREIQQAFLPRQYPVFPPDVRPEESALKFGHLYFPSGAVGGDFFDVLALSDSHVGIFISDVAGHGMRAALVVATLRGLIEELVSSAWNPGEFLTQMNRAYNGIFSLTEQLTFTTALYVVLDLRTGKFKYTTAGHPLPYLLRRRQGSVQILHGDSEARGPALGLFDTVMYRSGSGELEPGDLLLLYTDGLTEAEGGDRDLFESGPMEAALREHLRLDPESLLNALVEDARRFQGKHDFEDDVCLLAVELARLIPSAAPNSSR